MSSPVDTDLTHLDAVELGRRLAAGETSSVELTQAYLDRIAAQDETLGAYLLVDAEAALARAGELDAARAAGEQLGPLAGLPVALKDVFVTEGVPPTAHPLPLVNVLRDDVVRPSLDRAEVLAAAPSVEDDRFRVPPALGEER